MTSTESASQIVGVLYAMVMAALIVGLDVAFFKNRFLERLAVNRHRLLVFVAFYFRFLKSPLN